MLGCPNHGTFGCSKYEMFIHFEHRNWEIALMSPHHMKAMHIHASCINKSIYIWQNFHFTLLGNCYVHVIIYAHARNSFPAAQNGQESTVIIVFLKENTDLTDKLTKNWSTKDQCHMFRAIQPSLIFHGILENITEQYFHHSRCILDEKTDILV